MKGGDYMQRVIDIAMNEVGYLEKASNANLDNKTANASDKNYTKYWRDLAPGMQGQPWCNALVDWVFEKAYGRDAAKKMLYTPGTWSFYTPTSAGYFKNNNAWFSTPQKGDIIYFKNSTRIYHVGIVYEVKNGVVYTIEGNTSNSAEVVANGGCVAKKSYKLTNKSIAGFGRPNYALMSSASHTVVGCVMLNVRDGADKTHKVITALRAGDRVEILNSTDEWYQVRTSNGVIGWCSKKYIK